MKFRARVRPQGDDTTEAAAYVVEAPTVQGAVEQAESNLEDGWEVLCFEPVHDD